MSYITYVISKKTTDEIVDWLEEFQQRSDELWKTPDEVRPLVAFVSHAIMTLDVISKGLDHEIASHSVS